MSPLTKRLPRELAHNLSKYLGIFFLIGFTIAMISGYLAAARSIQRIVADARAASNPQDFSFTTQFRASDEALRDVRDSQEGTEVAEDFYADVPLTFAGKADGTNVTVRLYKNRTDIDTASYVAGRAPDTDDEIALDRIFMTNNGLSLGDTVTVSGHDLTIVGQCVLPDYEALVRKNSDLMFDVLDFSVAQVTPGGYDLLAGDATTYHYSARFADRTLGLASRTTREEDVSRLLTDDGQIVTELLDRESTSSITFADEDLAHDQVGYQVMLFLLIMISGFIFVVLTDATIEQESAIIGTLLATGYRTRELVRHYLILPTVIGVLAAIVGNAVGYGVCVSYMAGLYYRSYSFPTFHAYFDVPTFVETTVVPVALLILVTWLGIRRKLGATPLAFLRHEVSHTSRRSNAVLPDRWPFVRRFRCRVFLRNASHFAVLFLGIMLSSLLLLMGLCMLPIVRNAASQMAQTVRANHIYFLKAPLEIDETAEQRDGAAALKELSSVEDPQASFSQERLMDLLARASTVQDAAHPYNDQENDEGALGGAEKFETTTLEVRRRYSDEMESVTIYGIDVGSRHWDDVDVSGGKIVVGRGLADKCDLAIGRQATFRDKYTDTTYTLAPSVIAGNATDTNVYMSRTTFNELFGSVTGGDPDYFNGYASDAALNLDGRYVASEITPHDMEVVGDQMDSSMGQIMGMMLWIAIPISIVLIYLLTKTVIDRSACYISYMKVFGYRNGEIQHLYLRSVTWTVIGSYVISLPLVIWMVNGLVAYMMAGYSGNIEIVYPPATLMGVLAIGIATYLVVALIHMVRIRHVPLAEALKVQE